MVQAEVLFSRQRACARFLADIAKKVKVGQTEFKRYPENLLNSRVRYGRAFQVRKRGCVKHPRKGTAMQLDRLLARAALIEGVAALGRTLQMRPRATC